MPSTTHGSAGQAIILCAGLNAHSQLDGTSTADVRSFVAFILPAEDGRHIDILFSGWSNTVLQNGNRIWSQGHQQLDESFEGSPASEDGPYIAFGHHNGLLGILTRSGNVLLTTDEVEGKLARLEHLTTKSSPSISLIALTGTGRIALSIKQAPNGRLAHIFEFATLASFRRWYEDPSDPANYPEKHHMLGGRPAQLLAGTASFLLLMEDGAVHSWGDPRYGSLGRPIGDGAEKPGVVDALGGLKIFKIAAGGWMSAAVSEDGAGYLW
ncbi:hypothetical protein LTR53_016610, partial [Teratosphaeriaceae sp. CCFEE 6253]